MFYHIYIDSSLGFDFTFCSWIINDFLNLYVEGYRTNIPFSFFNAREFKDRYRNHKKSFVHYKYAHETELCKYVWDLKNSRRPFEISWSILKTATPCISGGKRCNLCWQEKLQISNSGVCNLLKKSRVILEVHPPKTFRSGKCDLCGQK